MSFPVPEQALPRPGPADFGGLMWYLARWENRFPAYRGRLQAVVMATVLPEDQSALDEANKSPYTFGSLPESIALAEASGVTR